ncbi:ctenidin-3-like [Hyla sarda]|uniref:ctenidin-3-like n=1 Tax=Hyla sarda TaxID=327740 RepID=UPI0024C3EDA3|nr:ctenidin-3-like [Hyla sarda]
MKAFTILLLVVIASVYVAAQFEGGLGGAAGGLTGAAGGGHGGAAGNVGGDVHVPEVDSGNDGGLLGGVGDIVGNIV